MSLLFFCALGRAPQVYEEWMNGWAITYNEHLNHDGALVFEHACRLGLEGIVSKRLDAPYRSGPSKTWLKSKNPLSEAVRREREEDWS
jgi:bifunctional non-homologous end joining protein LigD